DFFVAFRLPHFFRKPFLVLLPFIFLAFIITLIIALFEPIALWSAAAIEWLSAFVPAWVMVFGRWIISGLWWAGSVTIFALLLITSFALLILAIALIETLIFGRPRERLLPWLQARWN